MALHITKNPVFQCVNIGQCRNASRRVQGNVEMSNTLLFLNEPKRVVRIVSSDLVLMKISELIQIFIIFVK
jgi:hypothetical protein